MNCWFINCDDFELLSLEELFWIERNIAMWIPLVCLSTTMPRKQLAFPNTFTINFQKKTVKTGSILHKLQIFLSSLWSIVCFKKLKQIAEYQIWNSNEDHFHTKCCFDVLRSENYKTYKLALFTVFVCEYVNMWTYRMVGKIRNIIIRIYLH